LKATWFAGLISSLDARRRPSRSRPRPSADFPAVRQFPPGLLTQRHVIERGWLGVRGIRTQNDKRGSMTLSCCPIDMRIRPGVGNQVPAKPQSLRTSSVPKTRSEAGDRYETVDLRHASLWSSASGRPASFRRQKRESARCRSTIFGKVEGRPRIRSARRTGKSVAFVVHQIDVQGGTRPGASHILGTIGIDGQNERQSPRRSKRQRVVAPASVPTAGTFRSTSESPRQSGRGSSVWLAFDRTAWARRSAHRK